MPRFADVLVWGGYQPALLKPRLHVGLKGRTNGLQLLNGDTINKRPHTRTEFRVLGTQLRHHVKY